MAWRRLAYAVASPPCRARRARRHSLSPILSCTGLEHDDKLEHVRRLLAKSIDALVLIGSKYEGPASEGRGAGVGGARGHPAAGPRRTLAPRRRPPARDSGKTTAN